MKRSIFFLLTIIALGVACKKGDSVPANDFTGKWKLAATKVSPGFYVNYWTPVSSSENQYVQFNSNGTVESNAYIFNKYNKYVIKDSVTITMSKSIDFQNFRYKFIALDTIVVSPSGPKMCVEGCEYKFARQK